MIQDCPWQHLTYLLNIYKNIEAKNISSGHFNRKNNLNIRSGGNAFADSGHTFLAEYTDVGYIPRIAGNFCKHMLLGPKLYTGKIRSRSCTPGKILS